MKLTAAEIEQHFKDNQPEEDDDLRFQPAESDEAVEELYDPLQDDWWFDDYNPYEYDERYDDPYPCDDDYYF